MAWERDGDGDGDRRGHGDGDQIVVKVYINPIGCVAFCRLRDGNNFSSKISVR